MEFACIVEDGVINLQTASITRKNRKGREITAKTQM